MLLGRKVKYLNRDKEEYDQSNDTQEKRRIAERILKRERKA